MAVKMAPKKGLKLGSLSNFLRELLLGGYSAFENLFRSDPRKETVCVPSFSRQVTPGDSENSPPQGVFFP